MDLLITGLLIVALFVLLGSGVWIGIALAGVAWIGMELFSSRPAGDAKNPPKKVITQQQLLAAVSAERK